MFQDYRKIVFLYSPGEDWGLWEGVAEYASTHSQWLLYNPLYLQFDANDTDVYNWLKKFKPDGIIVPNSRDNLDDILSLDTNVIVHRNFRKKTNKQPVILGDGGGIGKMAAIHLMRMGFKYFGCYIYESNIPMQERAESFTQNVEQAGCQVSSFLKPRPESLVSWNNELDSLAGWLRSLPKPVGIMAGDDILSTNILMAARIAELLIPQQVAVVGVNNTKTICETQIPKLSSVALGYHKAGFEAAKLLEDLIVGKIKSQGQNILIEPTHVVSRHSTNFLAIQDEEVAKAVSFIHKSSDILIQVDDVVEQTNLSRTILQEKFKKAVGCTISQEIKRVCANQIADMLINTSMSVSEIALLIGFSDPDHISRYFKQSKGVTPSEYRRKYGSGYRNLF